jgi:PAS domain S-box-containing protein
MNTTEVERNLRILIVDDNRSIHEDFRKILCPAAAEGALENAEALLFNATGPAGRRPVFEIDSAYQGKDGLAMVEQAARNGRPYAMAFMDVRMPPGWDGVETAARVWEVCPDLQVVLCTAYSDYSWEEMSARLKGSDRLVILKKPFDAVEVLQLANALTEKWRLHQEAKVKLEHLEKLVLERTKTLQETNHSLEGEIAERKRVAESLKEKAALLDLAHDAIFVRDLDGRIRFWNKGAERLYGWTADEAMTGAAEHLFSSEDRAGFDLAQKNLLEHGKWNGEFKKHLKEGGEVILSSRWTLLRDEDGKPRSALVINTDITEKKKLEAQFLRSQRMEGIGTLATGMAHDLNNILAPILISAGALRWELSPPERELAISRIELSVKRGADIVQQVLTFGRGVSGERAAIRPADVLEEVAKIIGQTFPKNIELTVDAQRGLWPVMGDKTQIHQVLLNLCINARDAMPRGGGLCLEAQNIQVDEHYVQTAQVDEQIRPGPYVLMQVADTGEGIPPGNLEKIFDPFFTTKELGKGTGLGLSTVLGIVKSHQGFVTVESEVNRGTTFKVWLPAAPEAVNGSAREISGSVPRGQGEAILIVDDEANILSASRRILEQHGYQAMWANSGEEALSIFRRNGQKIDLVLTDIAMPGMDGVALIQALRRLAPALKIIASSDLGNDCGGDFRPVELESLGIEGFLSKPYTAEKLLTALQDALNKERHPATIHGSAPALAA